MSDTKSTMEKVTNIRRTWSLRRKILVGGFLAVIVLALALGLGLGLTIGRDSDDDDGSELPGDFPPLPTPTGTLPWTPRVNDTWQIILSHPPELNGAGKGIRPNVSIYDIDLFDTPEESIKTLHDLGKKVICYFSAGSYEEWRPDAKDFRKDDLGEKLDNWPGEKWINIKSQNVRDIMKKRIELAQKKGCDGVDPDNVDGYGDRNGVGLKMKDTVDYFGFLSSVTRPLNLTIGLKNAAEVIAPILPVVDFSVNEQCLKYEECQSFRAFIDAGKPVFHIEYPAGDGDVNLNGFTEDVRAKNCKGSDDSSDRNGSYNFSTVLKKMNLDAWVEYCNGEVFQANASTIAT